MNTYEVKENTNVLNYLMILGYNKTKAKALLKYRQVLVNGNPAVFNTAVAMDDTLTIIKSKESSLDIIYEDKDILVINKPSGLLSERTAHVHDKTAFMYAKDYLSKKHETVYLVHRLDKETSGVLMFIKNKKLYEELTSHWNDYVTTRSYIAIVEGLLKEEGKIDKSLLENKGQTVYISKEGKTAITLYKSLSYNKSYSYIHLQLKTGRKNQIRVHMSSIGHPVAGDKKYGAKSNPIKRLALHADRFGFVHPFTHQKMEFYAPVPESFKKFK